MNGRSGVSVFLERDSGLPPGDLSLDGLLTWFDRSGKIVGTVANYEGTLSACSHSA